MQLAAAARTVITALPLRRVFTTPFASTVATRRLEETYSTGPSKPLPLERKCQSATLRFSPMPSVSFSWAGAMTTGSGVGSGVGSAVTSAVASQVGSAEVSEVGSAETSVSGSEEVSVTGVSLVSGAASSGDGASV